MNNPEENPRFLVGVKKNPDGTRDFSHAAEMKDPKGEIAKKVDETNKEIERSRKEIRARKMEIPEDVKPGSASMVWFNLRNAIFVNEEAVNKEGEEGEREKLIETLKMQQTMLDNVNGLYPQDLIKENLDLGQSITAEEVLEKIRNLTPNKMYDLVQKYIIDHYESIADKGYKEYNLGDNHYPIKSILNEAHELQRRLMTEAAREGKN